MMIEQSPGRHSGDDATGDRDHRDGNPRDRAAAVGEQGGRDDRGGLSTPGGKRPRS